MRAKALLAAKSTPNRDDIVAALDGHLCRCGAHVRMIRAIEQAACMGRAAP
jgi:aerobic-type carbon monoxide dehydrogenase small subunit (CoxS/CutS family)